jgi:hypothetical protein
MIVEELPGQEWIVERSMEGGMGVVMRPKACDVLANLAIQNGSRDNVSVIACSVDVRQTIVNHECTSELQRDGVERQKESEAWQSRFLLLNLRLIALIQHLWMDNLLYLTNTLWASRPRCQLRVVLTGMAGGPNRR